MRQIRYASVPKFNKVCLILYIEVYSCELDDELKLRRENSMRMNHVKAALAEGKATFGAWLGLPSPLAARLTARAGYDWLMVDMEHSPLNYTMMAEIVGVIVDAQGPAPFVRVPENTLGNIKQVLDSGAWGILCPMVNSAEEAEAIVSWCKYPPAGTRSIGGMFAPLGFNVSRTEYLPHANNEVMVAIQIESKAGLDNVDKILAVPGIDIAFIGPNDLHASLGLTPALESTQPLFLEAVETIKGAAARHKVAMGILASGGEVAAQHAKNGFQFIGATSDSWALVNGLTQSLKTARGE
jgi:4-hydroxy-2-oxoheptanedioate aldolase